VKEFYYIYYIFNVIASFKTIEHISAFNYT